MSPLFKPRPKTPTTSTDAVAAEVDIGPRRIRVGDGTAASFVVTGYPAEVGYGWLEPLLTYPGRLDVSLHIDPVPPDIAADKLRRQMARLEASSRTTAEKGRLEDFEAEVAAEDARDMAASLARGEGKLFRVGLYITVHACDEETLEEEVGHVQALASSMLPDARPASYRQLHGWTSCLPLGVDLLEQRRSIVRPDAAGRWTVANAAVDFFLEYDTGTEPLRRLEAKLDAYHELARITGNRGVVLFWLPSTAREENLRHRITHPPVPAATAVHGAHPADTVWTRLDASARRRLVDLAETGPEQPFLPGWEEADIG